MVVKRSGERVQFERSKVVEGVLAAAKGRPVSLDQIESLAGEVEEGLRLEGGGDVATERIGLAVLDRLRVLDEVARARSPNAPTVTPTPERRIERRATRLLRGRARATNA